MVGPHFWMYWAVAIPVTLVVLTGWSGWLFMHRRREDSRWKGGTLARFTPRREHGLGRRKTGDGREGVLGGETAKASGSERPWAKWVPEMAWARTVSLRRPSREKVFDEEGNKRAEPGQAVGGLKLGASGSGGNEHTTAAGDLFRRQTSPLGPRRG